MTTAAGRSIPVAGPTSGSYRVCRCRRFCLDSIVEIFISSKVERSATNSSSKFDSADSDMDFEQRLQKAIDRGQKTRQREQLTEAERASTEEELKALHSSARLELTDHIEKCLKRVMDHLPGFEY